VQNKTSAYQVLLLLKQRYAPTTETRKRYIITKYQKMTQTPQTTVNIDAWVSQWENVYAEASELGIAEAQASHRALYDFLAAISPISPFFSEL
jgi:methylthioribose-1-phosphate isomerase